MKYYFYCPSCKYENEINDLPKNVMVNIRDGYGMSIKHFECPKCTNLDAGAMRMRDCSDDEKQYYRSVIKLYQGIRGLKNECNNN